MTSREEILELADAIQSLADRKRKISGANCGIIVSVAKADAIAAALRSQAGNEQEPQGYAHGDARSPPTNNTRLIEVIEALIVSAEQNTDDDGNIYPHAARAIADARRLYREGI